MISVNKPNNLAHAAEKSVGNPPVIQSIQLVTEMNTIPIFVPQIPPISPCPDKHSIDAIPLNTNSTSP
jgi:hypothetical protein